VQRRCCKTVFLLAEVHPEKHGRDGRRRPRNDIQSWGQISLKYRFVSKAPGSVSKKLGQPVWLSNFISKVKSGVPHPAHL
jgi:hypothetical protein